MRRGCAGRRADERGARVRVEVRRAFAHQIRSPQHAVRARLRARGLARHWSYARRRAARQSELLAEPAQRQTRGLRDAHHVPAIRDGVTEGVDAPFGSSAGRSVAAKTTPDVPMVALTAPGRVMPMPTAPAA